MCGIVGVLERDPGAPADPTLVDRLRDTLTHRGPDGRGSHCDGPVGLGQTRLAVIDVPGGRQPWIDPESGAALVYNGEVYNFRALRDELERAGRRFQSDSDTEVVMAAYLAWGDDFLERLNGMFALALWDARERRLLLARDRLGIKPLFVATSARRLAFASEPKALLALPDLDRAWDEQALHDYFHFRYVPGPRTAFRAIRQLPPGQRLVAEADGQLQQSSWWSLAPEPAASGEAIEVFAGLLRDAVSLRTVSDVPLGAFLSGGIDSGLVVAFLAAALEEPVKTFTVYDPEVPYYDERDRARQVATRFATDHRELVAATEVEPLLAQLLPTFDQPFADSGALPNLVICREGRKLVTVALSGLGGDELAAGYVRYLGAAWGRVLSGLPAASGRLLRVLADVLPEGRGLAADRAKRFARLAGLPEPALYTRMLGAGTRLDRPYLAPAFARRVDPDGPLDRIESLFAEADGLGLDRVNRLLYTDLSTYIPDDLLTLADRTSMRFGLEVRVPFLDHRLVAHALTIPGREKVRGRRLKLLLRRLAERWLPHEVVHGPKRGFSVPMADWLRGPLAPAVERAVETVGPETGILDRDALRSAWAAHRSGRASHEDLLWAVLVFTRWAEAHPA